MHNYPLKILRISSRENQPGLLVEPEHQIHILNGLTRGPFHQIVDRGKYDDLFPLE